MDMNMDIDIDIDDIHTYIYVYIYIFRVGKNIFTVVSTQNSIYYFIIVY